PEAKRFGTDGRPVPGCVARLADEAGRPVGPNVEGELLVYGPQLCVGYLDPALNAAFTPDGFLRTGDLAVMDDEGFIRIPGQRTTRRSVFASSWIRSAADASGSRTLSGAVFRAFLPRRRWLYWMSWRITCPSRALALLALSLAHAVSAAAVRSSAFPSV